MANLEKYLLNSLQENPNTLGLLDRKTMPLPPMQQGLLNQNAINLQAPQMMSQQQQLAPYVSSPELQQTILSSMNTANAPIAGGDPKLQLAMMAMKAIASGQQKGKKKQEKLEPVFAGKEFTPFQTSYGNSNMPNYGELL